MLLSLNFLELYPLFLSVLAEWDPGTQPQAFLVSERDKSRQCPPPPRGESAPAVATTTARLCSPSEISSQTPRDHPASSGKSPSPPRVRRGTLSPLGGRPRLPPALAATHRPRCRPGTTLCLTWRRSTSAGTAPVRSPRMPPPCSLPPRRARRVLRRRTARAPTCRAPPAATRMGAGYTAAPS